MSRLGVRLVVVVFAVLSLPLSAENLPALQAVRSGAILNLPAPQ